MKIPNFASLYHCGTSNFDSESQSGRNGPSWPPRSTSFRIAARWLSYLALALCHSAARVSAGAWAVGAFEDCVCAKSGKAASTSRHKVTLQRCAEPGRLGKVESMRERYPISFFTLILGFIELPRRAM